MANPRGPWAGGLDPLFPQSHRSRRTQAGTNSYSGGDDVAEDECSRKKRCVNGLKEAGDHPQSRNPNRRRAVHGLNYIGGSCRQKSWLTTLAPH
jgi:hypothetical protein